MNEAFAQWVQAYKALAAAGTELMWPSETLVRLFKGSYIPGLDKRYAGKSVLEVSAGNGNNLLFLGSLGLSLHATEVHEDLCGVLRAKMDRVGHRADVRVGENRRLPFATDSIDFLVSWNVLHYESDEAAIVEACAEYRRVMRPGGRLFLSTTGPEHKICEGSIALGGHRYQIARPDDFRRGQVFFYFDTAENLTAHLSAHYSDVLVGRTHSALMTETLDWFIATAVKPSE